MVISLEPAPRVNRLAIPLGAQSDPAWAFGTDAGIVITQGPVSTWHVSSTNRAGYLLDHDYLCGTPGVYVARVALATTEPLRIQLWNTTGGQLLAQENIPSSNGRKEIVTVTAQDPREFPSHTDQGLFIFRVLPGLPVGNNLEVRIWSPGMGVADVYSVGFHKVT
jgi:hypothetical protein